MPRNSKVGRCYDKLTAQGKSKGSAAAICQSATGQALSTGKPPMRKRHNRELTMHERKGKGY